MRLTPLCNRARLRKVSGVSYLYKSYTYVLRLYYVRIQIREEKRREEKIREDKIRDILWVYRPLPIALISPKLVGTYPEPTYKRTAATSINHK